MWTRSCAARWRSLATRSGSERVSIYLEDDSGRVMRGTWGTDLAGTTTDEREYAYAKGEPEERAHLVHGEGSRWLVLDDAPLDAFGGRRKPHDPARLAVPHSHPVHAWANRALVQRHGPHQHRLRRLPNKNWSRCSVPWWPTSSNESEPKSSCWSGRCSTIAPGCLPRRCS
jgi:hypothetical protein